MVGVRPWEGLAVAVSVDRALLGPEAAALLLRTLDDAIARQRSDGIASRQAAHVRDVLRLVAAQARVGHADMPRRLDLQSWAHDQISTAEVAEMLGVTDRQARRLVTAEAFGRPRMAKGAWRVSLAEVQAYIAERRPA